MLTKINTAALCGVSAMHVFIEISVRRCTSPEPSFIMVGLPDNAVKEARTRVMAALQSAGVELNNQCNADINFAPADVRKEGSGYDLPLAIALAAAHGKIKPISTPNVATDDNPFFATAKVPNSPIDIMSDTMLVGELGLDGTVRSVRGALSIAIKAKELGFRRLILPADNAREAAVVEDLEVYGAHNLREVVDFLNGEGDITRTFVNTEEVFRQGQWSLDCDFSEVKGQDTVKRAMEVAAAGGHNIILVGSPGCGKSMMAKRLPGILPPLTMSESLETTQIHSVAGKLEHDETLITRRPFRAPHHKVSDVAMIGGGTNFSPGEISLSHNGVLFLDEFPEYSRNVLETLRQPLEDRHIRIARAKYSIDLPCAFQLVAAMNPCPCGHYNDPYHECTCTPTQIKRYLSRISGPLLDRIDLQVEVSPVPLADLANTPTGESSSTIRERVMRAREIQNIRFADAEGVHCNAQMTARMIEQYARPTADAMEYLTVAMRRLNLSARAYERILKVSRTIADLAGSNDIERLHVAEALSYRNLDRSTWGE